MGQRLEVGLVRDQPKIDLWGREAKRGTSPVFGTDIPWRIVSPVDSRVPELFVGDQVLLSWNAQHPGAEKYPAMPDKKLTITKEMFDDRELPAALRALGGKSRDMSDAEYAHFLRLSGETAARLVTRLTLNSETPTEADIAELEEAIRDARSLANDAMVRSIVTGASLPTSEALAGSEFAREVAERAKALSRPRPIKRADVAKWSQERSDALQWLHQRRVSKQEVVGFYRPQVRKIKDPEARAARMQRLLRAISKL
jgi:hypothetical protein